MQTQLIEKFEAVPKEIPVISPATQWAQSVKEVYLRVKFATRFDSPACLDISELEHELTEKQVRVSALCRNDKKLLRYRLELPLENAINVDHSTVEVESVGRLLIKLEKASEAYLAALWPADFQRPKNLGVGWEMQGRYDEELKSRFPAEFKEGEEGTEKKSVFSPPADKAAKPEELEDDDEHEE